MLTHTDYAIFVHIRAIPHTPNVTFSEPKQVANLVFVATFVKLQKSDYKLRKVRLSVCLSVRVEQLGSHCTNLHKISYLRIFRKPVENSSFVNIGQE
jgi:hypothetical protein